jgi:type II secretory pathway pseudopilin PulG
MSEVGKRIANYPILSGPDGRIPKKLPNGAACMKILPRNREAWAFTLVELVMTTAIAAIVIGGSIYGYVASAKRAEWSAYSLAANSLAMQRVEQVRSTQWDPHGEDQFKQTNFPVQVDVLDIPISGTNIAYATSYTAITTVSANPVLRKIRVDTVWPFVGRGSFTNTIVTYRAPDQ